LITSVYSNEHTSSFTQRNFNHDSGLDIYTQKFRQLFFRKSMQCKRLFWGVGVGILLLVPIKGTHLQKLSRTRFAQVRFWVAIVVRLPRQTCSG